MASVSNKPSLVERGNLRFLIIDCPTDSNLEAYIKEMKSNNVCDLVRATPSNYSKERVMGEGVRVHDLHFTDGEPPPEAIINGWLKICATAFGGGGKNTDKKAVAVHCVAGLGRAPVLVAITLIEDGMEPLDAVSLIRSKRRGAINAKQLNYLQNSYVRSKKGGCIVV
jgi:protein tyrosine phosphatase type 4A